VNVGFLDVAEPLLSERRDDLLSEKPLALARPTVARVALDVSRNKRLGDFGDAIGGRFRGSARLAGGDLGGGGTLPPATSPRAS
jgi:hypothetical protein